MVKFCVGNLLHLSRTIKLPLVFFPRPCHQSAPPLHDAPRQCPLQSADPPRLIQSVPLFTTVHLHHAPAHHPPTHSHLTARFRQCLHCINRTQLINCLFHSLCQMSHFILVLYINSVCVCACARIAHVRKPCSPTHYLQ